MRTGRYKRIALALLLALAPAWGWAQAYPSRPIHMIIPAPAGGAVDSFARIVSQRLSIALGQSVISYNKPGAGTMIGSDFTAKSAPDGYTVLMITNSHAINAALRRSLPYDSVKDFAPVIFVGTIFDVLLINPGVPAKSVKDLLELGHKRQITYASAGVGSATHLGGVMFQYITKMNMLHVPFSGGTPALAGVMGGQVDMMFSNTLTALPLLSAGRLRALGIASQKRSPLLPDLPTIAEQGIPNFESGAWFGVLVPAHTPPAIIARLNREIASILQQPDVRKVLTAQGLEIEFGTPQQFGDYLVKDIDRWKKLRDATPGLEITN